MKKMMQFILTVVVSVTLTFVLVACTDTSSHSGFNDSINNVSAKGQRFIASKQGDVDGIFNHRNDAFIIIDNETKVEYLYIYDAPTETFVITPLYEPNGTLRLAE